MTMRAKLNILQGMYQKRLGGHDSLYFKILDLMPSARSERDVITNINRGQEVGDFVFVLSRRIALCRLRIIFQMKQSL